MLKLVGLIRYSRGKMTSNSITMRGNWKRIQVWNAKRFRFRFRYYYRGIRVPWLAWVMFS